MNAHTAFTVRGNAFRRVHGHLGETQREAFHVQMRRQRRSVGIAQHDAAGAQIQTTESGAGSAGNDVPAGASATPFQTSVSVLTLALAAPQSIHGGRIEHQLLQAGFSGGGISVLRFTEPKKLTEFFIENDALQRRRAISRSPINRRLSAPLAKSSQPLDTASTFTLLSDWP